MKSRYLQKIKILKISQNVGCDWKFDSLNTVDYCGICGGGNLSCNIFNGKVEFSTLRVGQYEPIMILPKGKHSLQINTNF